MGSVPLEREVKLRFPSASEAREAVLALGASPLAGRRLQSDALLDTADGLLRGRGSLIRIRRDGEEGRLTFKGPVQPSSMKLREERETSVGDPDVLFRAFEELGLRVWFRYEKYREEFSLGEVVIAIDETPVGVYVEIEGSEAGIASAAAGLGRGPADYVLDSYRGLFLQYREALGLRGSDMLFDPGA